MADTVIRSKIDASVKLEAQAILEKLGLSMSDAIRLFMHQVAAQKGLPFEIKLPAEAAKEHNRWFRQQVQDAVEESDKPSTAVVCQSALKIDPPSASNFDPPPSIEVIRSEPS